MEQPMCETCPYWILLHLCDSSHPEDVEEMGYSGECHRFPFTTENGWLLTNEDEWCGEHPDFPAWIAHKKANPDNPAVREDLRRTLLDAAKAQREEDQKGARPKEWRT